MLEEAIEIAHDVLDLIDDLPIGAEEFADSVRNKTVDILTFIEEREQVSPSQLAALQNMRSGVMRWLDSD